MDAAFQRVVNLDGCCHWEPLIKWKYWVILMFPHFIIVQGDVDVDEVQIRKGLQRWWNMDRGNVAGCYGVGRSILSASGGSPALKMLQLSPLERHPCCRNQIRQAFPRLASMMALSASSVMPSWLKSYQLEAPPPWLGSAQWAHSSRSV